MSETTKDQKTENPINFKAVNPRYQGARASDVVRALVKPRVRDRLAQQWEKKK